MFHNSQAVLAISKEPNPTVFQKTLGVNDYYFASEAWEFPMGNIQMVGKSVRRDVPRREAADDEAGADLLAAGGRRRTPIDFWLSTEDLPQPENRVTRRSARAS